MTVGKQIAICPALPSHMSNICRANVAQSYGQQCPVIWATIAQSYRGNNACKSCRGNNASHTEATLQACVWERKPLFSCTKLLEAFVGTIDIAVYDIHVVGAVCTTYMYSHVRTYVRMYERIRVHVLIGVDSHLVSLGPTCPVTQTINRRSSTVGLLLKLENRCNCSIDLLHWPSPRKILDFFQSWNLQRFK